MEIKNIMTKTVATINSEDTVQRAAQMMKEHNVGSVPVCREENVVGIITDRDIALRSVAQAQNMNQQKVKDIMSSNPVIGSPSMDVHKAANLMSERQIRRLPIVENNKLAGIVSLGDLAVEPKFSNEAGDALSNISTPSTPQI